MDSDLIIAIECILLVVFWPWLASFRGEWRNSALRRDNPHLDKCYKIRRWGTPVFFLIVAVPAQYFFSYLNLEVFEELTLSILVFFVTVFTGTLISELLVDYYRHHSHNEPFQF